MRRLRGTRRLVQGHRAFQASPRSPSVPQQLLCRCPAACRSFPGEGSPAGPWGRPLPSSQALGDACFRAPWPPPASRAHGGVTGWRCYSRSGSIWLGHPGSTPGLCLPLSLKGRGSGGAQAGEWRLKRSGVPHRRGSRALLTRALRLSEMRSTSPPRLARGCTAPVPPLSLCPSVCDSPLSMGPASLSWSSSLSLSLSVSLLLSVSLSLFLSLFLCFTSNPVCLTLKDGTGKQL